MIAADQPVCFPSDLLIAVSSKDDGTMLNRIRGRHVAEVLENRRRFCDQIGVKYDDVIYHVISYDQAQTFDTIAEVTETDTLSTTTRGFLLTRYIPKRLASAYFCQWRTVSPPSSMIQDAGRLCWRIWVGIRRLRS